MSFERRKPPIAQTFPRPMITGLREWQGSTPGYLRFNPYPYPQRVWPLKRVEGKGKGQTLTLTLMAPLRQLLNNIYSRLVILFIYHSSQVLCEKALGMLKNILSTM